MTHGAIAFRRRMSYDDYRSSVDSHTHSEWVDGEATVIRPQTTRHADLVSFLGTLFKIFVDHRHLGWTFMLRMEMKLLEGRSYRQPDLMFIAAAHWHRITAERVDGPADAVVEIVSNGTARRDRWKKLHEYAEAGIPEYWIVEGRDGRSGVDLLALEAVGRYVRQESQPRKRLYSRVLPGFWLDPAWLAADPLPSVVDCLRAVVPDAFRRET